jgi:hypothetical protein
MSTAIVEFNQFERDLAEYRARYENVVYDLAIPEQEKQAKSDRLSIGKKIAELDRVHAAIKAPLKEKVDLLDGERKRIKDSLLLIQGGIKSQIEEHEAAIKAAADALLRRASAIRELADFEDAPTSSVVRDRIAQIRAIVIDETFGEQQGYAALNKEKALQLLEPMLVGLEAQEKAAIEAEEDRITAEAKAREERESKIAADAAENARREAAEAVGRAEREAAAAAEREKQAAIKAEQDAKSAAERAEREKLEAVAKAESAAKRQAEATEKARLDAVEKARIETVKREANKKHCAEINRNAASALQSECGLSEDHARSVIVAIAKGTIPAVSVTY